MKSSCCLWSLGLGSKGPCGRSAVPGESGPRPSARSFAQVSQATRTPSQGPAVSTRCPGRYRPSSEGTRGRPTLPVQSTSYSGCIALGTDGARGQQTLQGESGPGPSTRSDSQVSRASRARARVPPGQPDVPGDTGLAPRACGANHLSRETRACVRGPMGLTSCNGHLVPGSKGLRGRQALPRVSGPCPNASVVL